MSHFFAYPYWLVILGGCTTRFVGDYHNISQPIIGVRIKHAEQWERAKNWFNAFCHERGGTWYILSYYPIIFWLGQVRLIMAYFRPLLNPILISWTVDSAGKVRAPNYKSWQECLSVLSATNCLVANRS